MTTAIRSLRERLTVQEESRTPDGGGGFTKTWSDLSSNPTVWARVEPLKGSEQLRGMALEGRVTHRVTIRARTDIDVGMRFRWDTNGDAALNVKSPGLNKDEKGRFMEFLVEQGGAV